MKRAHDTLRHSDTRHNTKQHGIPHRSALPCNAPRQSTPRHDTQQHDTALRGTARRGQPRHGTTQRCTAPQSRGHRNTAQTSMAQHRKARHDTARPTKAHHSTKARDTNRGSNPSKPRHGPEGEEMRPQPGDNATRTRRTPARGHRTPGNDGDGPPTQAASRKLKPARQRRRDTENPTPLNPGPHETASRNGPAGRARTQPNRKGHQAERVDSPPDLWGQGTAWPTASTNSNLVSHNE